MGREVDLEDASTEMAFEEGQNPWLPIGILIEISGIDLYGEYFNATERTEAVSRHGAKIPLQHLLGPNEEITIRRKQLRAASQARVVGQIGIGTTGHLYAVELIDNKNIWGIKFPPSRYLPSCSTIQLSCTACCATESLALNDLEQLTLQVNKCISRTCRACDRRTVWKSLVSHPEEAGREPTENVIGDRGTARLLVERRKHSRRKMKLAACLRQPPTASKDPVTLVDVSRGGIRFQSLRLYQVGGWVQVAVPYTRNSQNLFVPAKIAWVVAKEDWREYGLVYVASDSHAGGISAERIT